MYKRVEFTANTTPETMRWFVAHGPCNVKFRFPPGASGTLGVDARMGDDIEALVDDEGLEYSVTARRDFHFKFVKDDMFGITATGVAGAPVAHITGDYHEHIEPTI